MKRNSFIASLLAIMSIPGWSHARIKKSFTQSVIPGFKIKAGEGRIHGHIQLKGVNSNILDTKISGSDTNGNLAMFEQTSLSQGKGTPLHIHPNQDEIFSILEGEYYFQVGDKKYNLAKGDSIFLPRMVPHAWTQASKTGKMTVILQPAGKLEEFFVTVAALDHEPTAPEMAKIFADHEMQVVGPPLKL